MKLVCGVKCQGNGYSGRKEGRTGRRHDDFSVLKRFYFYFYKITHLPVHLSFVHVSVCTFYKVFFFFQFLFSKVKINYYLFLKVSADHSHSELFFF